MNCFFKKNNNYFGVFNFFIDCGWGGSWNSNGDWGSFLNFKKFSSSSSFSSRLYLDSNSKKKKNEMKWMKFWKKRKVRYLLKMHWIFQFHQY